MPDGNAPARNVPFTIGSGDAKLIMQGRRGELWKIKKGLAQPEDLTWKLPVQMGLLSEDLNRRFYQYDWQRTVVPATSMLFKAEADKIGIPCLLDMNRNPPAFLTHHPVRTWQECHLDGLVTIDEVLGIWEGKHTDSVSQWNDAERVVRHNWWQFVHQMMVHDLPWVEVSVIYGNGNDRKSFRVHRDLDEETILLAAEIEFLKSLDSDIPPPDELAVEGSNEVGVGGNSTWTKKYTEVHLRDMACANSFPGHAKEYRDNEGAAKIYEGAKKALKDAMPEDALSFTAHGIVMKRDSKGAVRFSRDKNWKETADVSV